MTTKIIEEMELNRSKERAEELGITLQEYLLLQVLRKLDDLKVTAVLDTAE